MSSAPLFLYERLQQVFNAKIREKQDFVLYRELPRLVRPHMLRSSFRRDSPFRIAVRDALTEEVFLGRIHIDANSSPARVCFTPTGIDFYTNYVIPPVEEQRPVRNWKRVGPSRRAAIDDYVAVVNIITSIQETISLYNAEDTAAFNVMNLTQTVRAYLDTEETLHSDISDLNRRLNQVNEELGVMRKEMDDIDGRSSSSDEEGYSLNQRSYTASTDVAEDPIWVVDSDEEGGEDDSWWLDDDFEEA